MGKGHQEFAAEVVEFGVSGMYVSMSRSMEGRRVEVMNAKKKDLLCMMIEPPF